MQKLPTEKETERFLNRVNHTIANVVQREAYKSGEYTKDGVKYPNLPNRSSAPYQSPTRQSGVLHDALDNTIKGNTIEVFTNIPYHVFLEKGTKYMEPRPLLPTAFKNANLDKVVLKEIDKFLR